jgi:hypothetical protein
MVDYLQSLQPAVSAVISGPLLAQRLLSIPASCATSACTVVLKHPDDVHAAAETESNQSPKLLPILCTMAQQH